MNNTGFTKKIGPVDFEFTPQERIANGLRWGKGKEIPELIFERDYRPIEGPTGDEGTWAWQFSEVQDIPLHHVWTIVEGDDGENWYASAGFHIVNKVHYVVTNVPWVTGMELAMYFDRASFDEESDG